MNTRLLKPARMILSTANQANAILLLVQYLDNYEGFTKAEVKAKGREVHITFTSPFRRFTLSFPVAGNNFSSKLFLKGLLGLYRSISPKVKS